MFMYQRLAGGPKLRSMSHVMHYYYVPELPTSSSSAPPYFCKLVIEIVS